MKNLITTLTTALASVVSLYADDEPGNPFNRLGVQLDARFNRMFTNDFYGGKLNDHGPQSVLKLSPSVNIPFGNNFGVKVGGTYYNSSQTETNDITSNVQELRKRMFGPSVSMDYYCDPCDCPEDCCDFFGSAGVRLDLLSGSRESTYRFGSNVNTQTGKITESTLAVTGGIAYRVAPNMFLSSNVDILSYGREKTITDNKTPDNYSRESNLGFVRNVRVGVRYTF